MAKQVKLEKIVSCSSEHPDFPAKNLLTCGEVPGSWLTAIEGESQATVVIQLDRKYQLCHLEIKNESSAFIEVLVANSDEEEVKFQVLLSASSFMTPNESKNLLNVNRCRVFAKEKLSPSALKLSFDLVKINCTQPFNKNIKYGLASIKLTEGEEVDPNMSSQRFTLTQSPGIKTRSNEVTPKGDDIKPLTPTLKAPDPMSDESSPSPSKRMKALEMKDSDNEPSTSNAEKPKRVKENVKKPKDVPPFCQLMSGVIFTISGFQNPLRSEIRSKGLQMGAKYRGDWDTSCTHLICAFPNTPKFNQVQATGTGKIITKEWIEDSYEQHKLLSWRKYNLDNQQKPKKGGNGANKKKRKGESDDDETDSEMDDFIVDDDEDDDLDDGDEEYDPKKDKNAVDDDEDLDELGPVVDSKLRDD